jgi:hypothetical protein
MLIILIVNIIIRLSYLFPLWTIDVVDFAPGNVVTEGKHIVTGSNHIVTECNHIVTVVTEEEDDVETEEEDNRAETEEEDDVKTEEEDNHAETEEEEDNCIIARDDVVNIVMVKNIVTDNLVEVKDSNIATVEDILNNARKNVLVKDHVIVVAIQEDQIVVFENNYHDWKTS